MAEEAPNAALSGNRKTSMLSRISQGAAVIVQGPHGKKMERAATDMAVPELEGLTAWLLYCNR